VQSLLSSSSDVSYVPTRGGPALQEYWDSKQTSLPRRERIALRPTAAYARLVTKIDLLDGRWYADDVHRHYDWMRAHEPVFHDAANDVWALTRYDDVTLASRQPELFRTTGRGSRPPMGTCQFAALSDLESAP
jgi:cytochrome P450